MFRVTGLFAGQYNTKLHGTITDLEFRTGWLGIRMPFKCRQTVDHF